MTAIRTFVLLAVAGPAFVALGLWIILGTPLGGGVAALSARLCINYDGSVCGPDGLKRTGPEYTFRPRPNEMALDKP